MNKTWMPTVAGILSIIAGGLGLLGSIFAGIAVAVFFSSSYDGFHGQEFTATAAWILIFVPYYIICILAVVGGVYSLKRKVWGLALAGAICTLLTIWAWPLGITSIVFASLSYNEFDLRTRPLSASIPPQSPIVLS